jgi:serine/threonine protein phosphatase 1
MQKNFKEIEDPVGRLYAIGDIHGCRDELAVLLDFLVDNQKISKDDSIVFIGDFIDRGPDSKGVVDLLIEFRSHHETTYFLKGNHEDMFLNYLGRAGRLGEGYLGNGGRECLQSYDIAARTSPDLVLQLLPPDHLLFYESLLRGVLHPRFLFVHAGINPNVTLERQEEEDVFWIREEFIDFSHDLPQTVIFGHTPFVRVFFDLPFKIGIDTGLVYGNRLTMIELKEGVLFQVPRGGDAVSVSAIL